MIGFMSKCQSGFAEKEMAEYAKAGVIAEEVLAGIRTVMAFGGQGKELDRYTENLQGAKKSGIIRGVLTGISSGLTFFIMFSIYGLAFWYGTKLIMDDIEGEDCLPCHVAVNLTRNITNYSECLLCRRNSNRSDSRRKNGSRRGSSRRSSS